MKITDLDSYVEHSKYRILQEILNDATAQFWLRRARQFAAVGNARCDEIAQACRNRAALALGSETPDHLMCQTCGTPTSPRTCSCGATRIEGGGLDDVA